MKYKIIYLTQFNTSAVFQVSSVDNTFKYDRTNSSRIYTINDGKLKLKADYSTPASASQRALVASVLTQLGGFR